MAQLNVGVHNDSIRSIAAFYKGYDSLCIVDCCNVVPQPGQHVNSNFTVFRSVVRHQDFLSPPHFTGGILFHWMLGRFFTVAGK
jgi:hypothetical protein